VVRRRRDFEYPIQLITALDRDQQVGVAELLDAARLIGHYPATVTLIGLVPDSVELGVARSAAVAASLDKLVAAIVREVAALGYPMVPQTRTGFGTICSPARHFGM
jgi:hydrogenase maturation protease